MGLFKKAKNAINRAMDHPLKTAAIAAASYFGGPLGGMAAKTLLTKPGYTGLFGNKKPKDVDTAEIPTSPMAFLPAFSEMATRPQTPAQTVEGGDIAGASSDLLGEDIVNEEVKKRRAARLLLG